MSRKEVQKWLAIVAVLAAALSSGLTAALGPDGALGPCGLPVDPLAISVS